MIRTETRYVVEFEGLGFYAINQPDWQWSFTLDINKAVEYKTQSDALERGRDGSALYNSKGERTLDVVNGLADSINYRVVTMIKQVVVTTEAGPWSN